MCLESKAIEDERVTSFFFGSYMIYVFILVRITFGVFHIVYCCFS